MTALCLKIVPSRQLLERSLHCFRMAVFLRDGDGTAPGDFLERGRTHSVDTAKEPD
jgi:hypothetical protein